MDRCAAEEALNKFMRDNAEEDKNLEAMLDSLKDEFQELEKLVKYLKDYAKDYNGYDFSEYMEEEINERL